MTDREKVIKGLECCWDVQSGWKDARYVCPICPYTDNGIPCETLAPLMEDALALLKAQEPVEPVIEKNISSGECEDPWGRLFFCGACGKRINEKYNPDEDDKYCKRCGQAVKWK